MAYYNVPPDTNEPDKIIGGVLTIGEVAWLSLGLLVAAVVALICRYLFGGATFLIGLIFLPVGVPFVWFKVKGMKLASFIKYKMKYLMEQKAYINIIPTEGELTFTSQKGDSHDF